MNSQFFLPMAVLRMAFSTLLLSISMRLSITSLRQCAANGRKVFYMWDRAGIDFQQWHRWKQGGGVYFLSREKADMQLEVIGKNRWERADPRNAGVLGYVLFVTD